MSRRIRKHLRTLLDIPGMVIYGVPALVLYCVSIRFVRISNPHRIGHLTMEPERFVKEMILGDRPRVTPVLLMSDSESANPCLLKYWERYIAVVRSKPIKSLLRPFHRFRFLRIDLFESQAALMDFGIHPEILARWGARPPVLDLDMTHREQGEKALETLGVPAGAWFVCVHSREGGYSPLDEHVHDYRNSPISSYSDAMKAIVARGGLCIRMGDASMEPLEKIDGVVDYAHSDLKSDWMDVFLCARCRFFLGNTSGLWLLSTVFGVPAALANLTPFVQLFYSYLPHDIRIPKLLKNSSGELLSFREILGAPAFNFRSSAQFEAEGFTHISNSPDEIRDLAVEMMDRLEGVASYTDEDKRLQARFQELYAQGRDESAPASRIGRDFLRKYAHLL